MKKINLIPPEMSVGSTTSKLAKQLKTISTVGAAISVFVILVLLGVFGYYSYQLRDITQESEEIKNRIGALQQSEQKLVFAKDRLEKIDRVQKEDSVLEELANYDYLYDFLKLNSEMNVTEVNIDSDKMEISLMASSLSATNDFFEHLDKNNEEYEKVTVSVFSYNPTSGYILGLEFEEQ